MDGSPAHGVLWLDDGAGSRFERFLETDGSTQFFFSTPGEWTLGFADATKKVRVKEKNVFAAPTLAELSGSKGGANGAGGAGTGASNALTGFFNWGVSPEWIAVAVLFLALAGVAYYRIYYSASRLRKSFDGKRVRLELSAGRGDLNGVILVDYAPEEAVAASFSEKPSVSETVTGKVFKWRRETLAAGEAWVIEYDLREVDGERLKKAEAFCDSGGKRLNLFS